MIVINEMKSPSSRNMLFQLDGLSFILCKEHRSAVNFYDTQAAVSIARFVAAIRSLLSYHDLIFVATVDQ